MNRQKSHMLLNKYNIFDDILLKYDESHRFYHNWDHIQYMLDLAEKGDILTDKLHLAILFHDIVYDPKEKDNEEKSANYFYSFIQDEEIKQAILDTKHHKPSNVLSKQLCYLDLYNLYNDFDVFYDNSMKIFKEYQFVDFKIYKEERKKMLESYGVASTYIKALDKFIPKIGVYAGSFNPFHKGHFNVLDKAEKIFDKIIIARGINKTKNNELRPLPDYLKYRQIEYYDGLLTDFIDSLGYDVTLIRGLRNITDLQFELTQFQYMQEFKPDIKIVSIFCDKEFDHISSSSIRMLEEYGKSDMYL